MFLCDIHTHSIASGHGTTSTIADMAKTAYAKGLTCLGISDHGPATMGSAGASYYRSLAKAPKKRCGIDLLYGVELNILDFEGSVDVSDEILEQLDYAIISLHQQNTKPGTMEENTQAYIKAMEHPKVKIIGHCDDVAYPVDYPKLIQAAKEKGVVVEINNASLQPDGYRGDTLENNIRILVCCALYQVPILLSSDSHGSEHIGDFTYAEELVEKTAFPKNLILNYNSETFISYFK